MFSYNISVFFVFVFSVNTTVNIFNSYITVVNIPYTIVYETTVSSVTEVT